MWLVTCLAGSMFEGNVSVASTSLTADINAAVTTIPVVSTEGFSEPGTIVIGDERIAYSDIAGNNFDETLGQPLVRGAEDTIAIAHSAGARVRTVESGMMNTAVTYNIAVIADATGLWGAVTIGLAILRILGSFFTLPIGFLGTDLAIIGVIWWCMVAGMIISLGLALAGARRV